jgi:hypothetical protein
MKFIIKEESLSKSKMMIDNLIQNRGVRKTLKNLNLNLNIANKLITPTNGEKFTSDECREILEYFIFYKKELPSHYKDDEVIIDVDLDDMSGSWKFTIYFDKNEKEGMLGYATMFWDDDVSIPVDVDYYVNLDNGYETDFEYHNYMAIDDEFTDINQLVNYYKTNYFPVIKHYTGRALSFARDEMYEWIETHRS